MALSSSSPPPGRQADGSSDRRWIILCEDGRFSTLGRARDPSKEDVENAEVGLKAQGLAGWLAVMSGSQYATNVPSFIEVRPLACPTTEFSDAVGLCLKAIQSHG